MVENRRALDLIAHLIIWIGIALVVFPLWLTFVASTLSPQEFFSSSLPLLPGGHFLENYRNVLFDSSDATLGVSVMKMLGNSLVMALGIAIGKIIISLLAAYAIVFFRFRGRMLAFWTIFITLMLPVEVRILPTYQVVADLDLLDSYTGLILPLIASATATFLLRQFFMTVPSELVEAARVDGAGPIRFLVDILLPLSRTNLAALFVIMFIYGWNQYLWPLITTTDESMATVVTSVQRMLAVGDTDVRWEEVLPATVLAMLPPVLVVILMQRLFVKGLIETEK